MEGADSAEVKQKVKSPAEQGYELFMRSVTERPGSNWAGAAKLAKWSRERHLSPKELGDALAGDEAKLAIIRQTGKDRHVGNRNAQQGDFRMSADVVLKTVIRNFHLAQRMADSMTDDELNEVGDKLFKDFEDTDPEMGGRDRMIEILALPMLTRAEARKASE